MSRVTLNNSIDTVFNNDVEDESLSPLMVAEKLKEVANYAEEILDESQTDTAFVAKTYAATMSIIHDPKKPNFEINLTGNLDLTLTGTENRDSGLVNLYFSATETATINGIKPLSLIGNGVMIPIYFIHDTDGIKWYDGREATPINISTLALKQGTKLNHLLPAVTTGTISNVGVNCTISGFVILPKYVGAKVVKTNGEVAYIATVDFGAQTFTTTESFTTNSTSGFNLYCVAYAILDNGFTVQYDSTGGTIIVIEDTGNVYLRDIVLYNNGQNTFGEGFNSFGGTRLQNHKVFLSNSTGYFAAASSGTSNEDVILRAQALGVWEMYSNDQARHADLMLRTPVIKETRTYANDAAADADTTLLQGSLYFITGDRIPRKKP